MNVTPREPDEDFAVYYNRVIDTGAFGVEVAHRECPCCVCRPSYYTDLTEAIKIMELTTFWPPEWMLRRTSSSYNGNKWAVYEVTKDDRSVITFGDTPAQAICKAAHFLIVNPESARDNLVSNE